MQQSLVIVTTNVWFKSKRTTIKNKNHDMFQICLFFCTHYERNENQRRNWRLSQWIGERNGLSTYKGHFCVFSALPLWRKTIKKNWQIFLQPEKIHRYVSSKRRDGLLSILVLKSVFFMIIGNNYFDLVWLISCWSNIFYVRGRTSHFIVEMCAIQNYD